MTRQHQGGSTEGPEHTPPPPLRPHTNGNTPSEVTTNNHVVITNQSAEIIKSSSPVNSPKPTANLVSSSNKDVICINVTQIDYIGVE